MKISKDDEKFLIELSKKINNQDKRSTSYVYFMVSDDVKVYGSEEFCSERERREEYNPEYLCEKCAKLYQQDEEVPEECPDCDSECFNYFNLERQIMDEDGVYFTAEACDEYINRRRYQFNNPKSYGLSAYWSEEMKKVMEIISKLTTDKILLK